MALLVAYAVFATMDLTRVSNIDNLGDTLNYALATIDLTGISNA